MKILHLTDIEGYKPTIPEEIAKDLDLILLSGDISIGTKSLTRNAKVFNKIADMLPKGVPVYYIPGNREYPDVAKEFEGMPESFHPLHNHYIKVPINSERNLFVIGFGGAIPGILNNFAITEEQFKSGLTELFEQVENEKSNEDIVILMVHNPPKNTTLDFAMTTKKHIGSLAISEIIENYRPNVCVCGHVHESGGIEMIGETQCVNPGASKFGNASSINIIDKVIVKIIRINTER